MRVLYLRLYCVAFGVLVFFVSATIYPLYLPTLPLFVILSLFNSYFVKLRIDLSRIENAAFSHPSTRIKLYLLANLS